MSINDETSASLSTTKIEQKLELFTNRYQFIRIFAEYLNEELPRQKILFFYGDGGNSKTLLLNFLREKCCKHFPPDIWHRLKAKSDVELASQIEQETWDYTRIPSVIHDFGQQPIGDDRPQDPFYGLLLLRRNLEGYGLRFPLYSYACIWYLYRTGKLEKAKQLLPAEEIDLLSTLVDFLSQNSWASLLKVGLNILGKHWSQQLTMLFQRRGLPKEDIERIHTMKPETELINELPLLFAADLNAIMQQPKVPPRIVLFFDTHEAFWGNQRDLQGEQLFYPDEWLRQLLKSLILESGIVVVVAGRDQPSWTDAPKDTKIPPFDFELYRKLGQALDFDATKPAFEILIGFPFVWKEEQRGKGWYRIHELLRRLDYDEDSKDTKHRAHQVLEQHYREIGEVAEAIYHAICQDWQRGIDEWLEVFNIELERSNYEQCRTLLKIRNELSLNWLESPNQ
ncbi:MAG: hypothetical protein U7127_24950 [Phormidium sp.]